MTPNAYLAIDIGTTSAKAALYSTAGQRLAVKSRLLTTLFPRNGWAEQDPQDWWQAVGACTRELLAETGSPPVLAVCVSGQTPACLPVDERGQPLRPAMIWQDRRSTLQVDWIIQNIGSAAAERGSGNRVDSYFGGPKWLWFRQNEPELYTRTWKILQASGYINFMLTGQVAIDPSQAGLCAPCFNLSGCRWDAEILDRMGIDAGKLPEILPTHAVIGAVTPSASAMTGIAPGVPVLCGGGDFAFACLGTGVFQPDTAALMLGTSGNLLFPNVTALDTRLFNSYHVTGQRLSLGGVYAGGSVKWIASVLQAGGPDPLAALDQEASQVPAGSDGLIFLPYLMGERSPIWDAQARGVFFGLSAGHTRAHLYRAVLEGVAFAFRSLVEITRANGTHLSSVTAADGGSRSPLWRRILADILQLSLCWRKSSDETLTGAAYLAAYGSGAVKDFDSMANWLAPLDRIEPEDATQTIYGRNYLVFQELYPRNASLFINPES